MVPMALSCRNFPKLLGGGIPLTVPTKLLALSSNHRFGSADPYGRCDFVLQSPADKNWIA